MKAVFRREARRLSNGATLLHWELQAADGSVVDECLATAPSLQGGEVFFVTAENVDHLDGVSLVAPLSEIERGKRISLYRIPTRNCTIESDLVR
jgi:hypothetical protein